MYHGFCRCILSLLFEGTEATPLKNIADIQEAWIRVIDGSLQKPTMIDTLTTLETKVPATSCINLFDWWWTLSRGSKGYPQHKVGSEKAGTLVLLTPSFQRTTTTTTTWSRYWSCAMVDQIINPVTGLITHMFNFHRKGTKFWGWVRGNTVFQTFIN